MADRLTTDASEPPEGLSALWPFPGTILLVVFGAWLAYMGSIAGMEDVATAFYGLGGVTGLLVVLSLRAMSVGRVQRRSATEQPARRRRHGRRAGSGRTVDELYVMPRRSAIVDEGAAPVEGAIYPGAAGPSGMPLNARMRARQEEIRAVSTTEEDDDRSAVDLPAHARRPEPTDTTFEPTEAVADERGGAFAERRPVVAEPIPSTEDDMRFAQMRKTIRQLEAAINRERAERGAQVAKLEALVMTEAGALRAEAGGQPDGPADGEGLPAATARRELASAVDAIAGRLAALEAQAATQTPRREGDEFVTIGQFNNALNNQLMPLLAQLVEKRVAAALDAETSRRGTLIEGAPVADGDGADGTLGERIARAHEAIAAANEAARTERDAIREEMTKLGRSAQRALAAAMNVRRSVGEMAEGDATLVEQLEAMRASLGGAGGTAPAVPGAVEERLAATMRDVEELRGNVGAITQHVARMGEHYQDLLARLDRIGDQIGSEPRQPAAGGVEGEVNALRDALTTIIEQNREIRAQQEMLSARFDGPRGER